MKKRVLLSNKSNYGGPHLAAAVFCENAVQDKDNVFSVFRIIDRIIIYIPFDAPDDVPSNARQIPIETISYVSFKTGDSPGDHLLKMTLIAPSGKRNKSLEHYMKMTKDPNGGANIKLRIAMSIESGGMYWMEVSLDGKVRTMIPLHIEVERKNFESGAQMPEISPQNIPQIVPKGKKAKKKP